MNKPPNPKPLSGLRVLVGRARHQASALSSALRKLGADVIGIPFIEIRKPRSTKRLDEALRSLRTYDWLVLTSVNGVEALWDRLKDLQLTNQDIRRLKIAAIGPATKNAIEKRGLKVNVVPKQYVAELVVKSLRGRVNGKRVLLARAKIARDVIPTELRKAGAYVDVVEAYETIIPPIGRTRLRTALKDRNRRPHIITFTSSSTVKNFVALMSLDTKQQKHRLRDLEGIRFASIGPVTSSTLRSLGFEVHIEAKQYTIPGLVTAIKRSHSKCPPRTA